MGTWTSSLHFRTDNVDLVRTAAGAVARPEGGHMLMTQAINGWINVYPEHTISGADAAEEIARHASIEHAVVFLLCDSDVLCYWYFHNGQNVDYFNSCPDYFGEADPDDMEAAGDADTFKGLLDAAARAELSKLISGRMISGEITGDVPDFEEERLAKLGSILGIAGALGSFEYLKAGEEIEGVGGVASMIEV